MTDAFDWEQFWQLIVLIAVLNFLSWMFDRFRSNFD